jgi:hypothetical protein
MTRLGNSTDTNHGCQATVMKHPKTALLDGSELAVAPTGSRATSEPFREPVATQNTSQCCEFALQDLICFPIAICGLPV